MDPQVTMGFNTKLVNVCPNNQYELFLCGCDGVNCFLCATARCRWMPCCPRGKVMRQPFQRKPSKKS